MTTNGYLLTSDVFNQLCNYRILQYQISLDGIPENHDKTRVLANGGKTFDTIWNNLLKAKQTNFDFKMIIRVHYFLENYTELIPLIHNIDSTFLTDTRFSIFLKAIERLGGTNDATIKLISEQEQIEIQNTLASHINNLKNINNISEVFTPNFVCYAAEPNSFVIRSNGAINKCTTALYSDYNNVGKINSDGTLTINNRKFFEWSKGFKNLDRKLLSCPNQFMKEQCLGLH